MGVPVVIEARGVSKTFRIPEQRIDSLKERFTHPFQSVAQRELHALHDVSFDVHKGEFFGIVGRNGSGKSTLLKILASIYAADAGTVRVAGRMAPFIELGVGFNPELVARDNVALNGVLMGLGRREAAHRHDAVLDFADLRDFADLKVKNYSSGMMVRLAFAIMIQADAEIMLIDEVLAVGDAAFAKKCMDVFAQRRAAGRTVVLVTHDMATVTDLCHRAMLLHDGELQYVGDPEESATRYFRKNFAGPLQGEYWLGPEDDHRRAVPDFNVRVVEAGLRAPGGGRSHRVARHGDLIVDVEVEALRELRNTSFVFHLRNEADVTVARFVRHLQATVAIGERVRIEGALENRLVPGGYRLDCWVRRDRDEQELALQAIRLLEFEVEGDGGQHGVVDLDAELQVVPVGRESPG